MRKLKLLLLLGFALSFFTGEAQVKNYTIEAITRLETQGTFIYQGSTIAFTTGFLNKENGGTGIDGAGFTFYHSGNLNLGTVPFNALSYSINGTDITVGGALNNFAYLNQSNPFTVNQIFSENIGIRTATPQGHLDINTEDAEATKVRINGEVGFQKRLELRHFDASEAGLENNMFFIATKAANQVTLGHVNESGVDVGIITINQDETVDFSSTINAVSGYEVNGVIVISASSDFIGGSGDFDGILTSKGYQSTLGNTNFNLLSRASGIALYVQHEPTTGTILQVANGSQTAGGGNIKFLVNDISTEVTNLLKERGTFTSGFAGNNWQLDPDDNALSHLTIDRLTVRDRMDVYELVINQIRATNGSLWVSDAVKVETVAGTTLNVNDDTDITFQVNDVIKAQQFDGRNVRTYTATVATVGATSFTVSSVVGTGWDGMELVRIGNTTDTDRQGAVYITSSDNNAPYIDIIDGNTDTSLSGDVKGRFGRLDGITSATFGALSGYGFWTENGYLEGSINATGGEIAGWTITSPQLASGNIEINSTGYIRHTADAWRLNADGSGILSNGAISWTSGGVLDVNRITATTGTIGAWTIGATTLTGGNITLNSNGTISNSTHYSLNNDGSGFLAEGNISWTAAGVLDVDRITASDGTIGAFSIDATYIWTGTKQIADAYSVAGMTIGNGAIRAQKFRVDTDGTLYATDGNFSGTITGSTITGGTIQSATTGQRVVIESAGNTLSFYDSSNVQRIIMDDNLLASRPAIKITEGAFYATDGVSLSYMSEDLVLTPEIQADDGTITTLGSTTISATSMTTTNMTISGIKQIDGQFTSSSDTDQFVSLSSFFTTQCIGAVVGGNANTGVLQFIVRGSGGVGNIGMWVDRDNAYTGSFTVQYVAWGF